MSPFPSLLSLHISSLFSLQFSLTLSHFCSLKHIDSQFYLLDSTHGTATTFQFITPFLFHSLQFSSSLLILCIETLSYFCCFHRSKVCFDGSNSHWEMYLDTIEIPPLVKQNSSISMKQKEVYFSIYLLSLSQCFFNLIFFFS